jgi:hypothetical protein
MNDIILENIPFNPELSPVLKKLHLKENSQDAADFKALLLEAKAIANPKAMYKLSPINEKEEGNVVIDGVRFTSRVLRVNLDKPQRVFPFIGTCGMELQEWSDSITDMFVGYWAEAIKELALFAALEALASHLDDHFRPGTVSTMSPGSLQDWPISEQRPLFKLMGNTREKIGVELTESCLMVPTKSVSGIRFPIDETFESCQLCPRTACPNRRAPYDETLYEKKYCPKSN